LKKIGFIGCGHLAKSLISGLEKSSEYQISGYDILEANLNWLNERGHAAIGLEECLDNSDILFLCVKPQDMPELCSSIADRIKDDINIISVAAGVKLQTLFDLLPSKKIFRVMTNVGTKDNLGVTAVYSQTDNSEILNLFNFLGKAFEVNDENQIDIHWNCSHESSLPIYHDLHKDATPISPFTY
jgi:pyrroline-5-carboxylate reductase